ncbi:MAG: GNAT family N-acetyltransferase [Gammaproteobacteria bacterium]
MKLEVVESLAGVPAASWDALAGGDPFLRHGFLHGLEATGCLEPQGWYAQHLLAWQDHMLVAALPLYLRENSYGEFVFDWSWADAYERAGGRYYPKLVTAVPFAPVSGRRVLAIDGEGGTRAAQALIAAAVKLCNDNELSSWHCLFHDSAQTPLFEQAGLVARLGCQYHWHNDAYADFDAFLAALNSKKRKQIRRERRQVEAQDLVIETLVGDAITPEQWQVFHRFYCSTFHRKWGEPRLTEEFFQTLDARLPGVPVLILARAGSEYVAGAFALRGPDTLYGRHWGCSAHHDNLHFELCYYQTIDFCIRHGLRRLDAGAQGEHKLARGFVPVKTWSTHWIRDEGFRRAVRDFVKQERHALEQYIADLDDHLAFRRDDA